jgi:hypothetical protein
MAIRMMNISSSGCLMPAGRNLGSTSSYTHEKGLNRKFYNVDDAWKGKGLWQ